MQLRERGGAVGACSTVAGKKAAVSPQQQKQQQSTKRFEARVTELRQKNVKREITKFAQPLFQWPLEDFDSFSVGKPTPVRSECL